MIVYFFSLKSPCMLNLYKYIITQFFCSYK
nr:MAG TPA: hypothetical protein [Caudoviricetes sp.]